MLKIKEGRRRRRGWCSWSEGPQWHPRRKSSCVSIKGDEERTPVGSPTRVRAEQILAKKSTNLFPEIVKSTIATGAGNKIHCNFSSRHLWQNENQKASWPTSPDEAWLDRSWPLNCRSPLTPSLSLGTTQSILPPTLLSQMKKKKKIIIQKKVCGLW